MKNSRITLICTVVGLLVAAYSISVGLGNWAVISMFVGTAIFCFASIFFALHILPELLSRHIERQLNRRER